MEQKLQSVIPQEKDSVLQYALGSQDAQNNPSTYAPAQRNSVSVLRTFARNSAEYARPVEPLNNGYARLFTTK